MVKNTLGGYKGKSFARKLSNNNSILRLPNHPLELFACVHKLLGNGRVLVRTFDNIDFQCVIRNKFRGRSKRNNLISVGSFVLIGLHEWENPPKHADILSVYSNDDLISLKSLPSFSNFDSFLSSLFPDKLFDNSFSFSTDLNSFDISLNNDSSINFDSL